MRQLLVIAVLAFAVPVTAMAQSVATTSKGQIAVFSAAQAADENIAVPAADQSSYPTLNMTPDKSEILRLDREAASVIIGNPLHLSVLTENAKTLVLVPRTPGATYISVLDAKAEIIMQRHVIVAAPAEKYVRIRRSCAGSKDKNCQSTAVYYCPGMCHEVGLVPKEAGEAPPTTGMDDPANANAGGESEQNSDALPPPPPPSEMPEQ